MAERSGEEMQKIWEDQRKAEENQRQEIYKQEQEKQRLEQQKASRHALFEAEREAIRKERKEAEIKAQKEAEEQKRLQKEANERARRRREIDENVARVKQKQEDAEKTREWKETRKRNEARIQAEKDYAEHIKAEKSSAARIRLRQQEEERIRLENLRISAANKGIRQQENVLKPINAERLKGAVREAVSRSPGILDRAVTGIFTPVVQQATHEKKQPDFTKRFKQESREFSRAVSSSAKKPVTGGKVKPVSNMFAVSADERFANSLLGGIGMTQQQYRQPAKTGKQQVQQQPEKMDPTKPLNNLLKRIF